MSQSRPLRHRVREPLIGAFLQLVALLPYRANQVIGGTLGKLLYRYAKTLRETARINIRACLPELDEKTREDLVQSNLIETGKGMTEAIALWIWPEKKIETLIQAVEGEEHVKQAIAAGKGVIIMTPHLGCWEIVNYYVSRHYPMTTLYKEHRVRSLDRVMAKGRARFGAAPVNTDINGVRALIKALKKGETVGILPDQDPGYEAGEFTPFFGIPAVTMTLTSKLMQKTDSVVISTIGERLENGRGLKIRFSEPVTGIDNPDLDQSMLAVNQEVEKQIRLLPAQYLWSYQRFRRRPKGEPPFY